MGIPKFYRWLSERYPQISQDASNAPEVDNFYLDMNGIIHVSAHSNSLGHLIPHLNSAKELPEVWSKIFAYIEMLVQLIKPKKLLYLALDGVAPRAKMNNQRERRYKSIYDIQLHMQREAKAGRQVEDNWFDSNAISPGTPFMLELNHQLKCFIKWKLQNDVNWKHLEVVLSGSDVPGEGEHKIMRYIRNHKTTPNQRHCIYGLDADLILLGLIAHEPYTVLLREEVKLGSVRSLPDRSLFGEPPKFQCLYINVLREYLTHEIAHMPQLDLERFIDDFVVLMLFVGNDFIPRLPTFEINEGAVNKLLDIYKAKWQETGYLSEGGVVNWEALNTFLKELPKYEYETLEKRIKSKKKGNNSAPMKATKKLPSIKEVAYSVTKEESDISGADVNEEFSLEQVSAESAVVKDQTPEELKSDENLATQFLKEKLGKFLEEGIHKIKKFYYSEHLRINLETQEGQEQLKEMIQKYLEGIQWVMFYYFEGVSDWQWYYPYHYAPMVSDFIEFQAKEISFDERGPFRPVEQLMGVLPPYSVRYLIPIPYQNLLKDPSLAQYFPEAPGIEYDSLCAQVGWQSMKVIVPFVPFDLLVDKARQIQESDELQEMNACRQEKVFWFGGDPYPEKSTLPQLIPDFECCVKEAEMHYERVSFTPTVLQGTAEVLPGFPSLKYLNYVPEEKDIAINVFQVASPFPTMVLSFLKDERTLQEAFDQLYDKQIYVDYPCKELGVVVGVSDETQFLPEMPPEYFAEVGMSKEGYLTHIRNEMKECLRATKGLEIKPELGTIVHFLPLKMMKKTLQGNFIPEWADEEFFVPLELVMLDREKGHPKNPPLFKNLSEEFQVGKEAIVLTKGEKFGSLGKIKGYCNDKFSPSGGVKVVTTQKPKFIYDQIKDAAKKEHEKYYTIGELARILKRPIGLVNRFLGTLKVNSRFKGKTKILQIGLNLKNEVKSLVVLRYARWAAFWNNGCEDKWQFSQKTLEMLKEYSSKYKEMWNEIEVKWTTGKRKFELMDIFRYAVNPLGEAEQVALWISKLPSAKEPWASIFSEYLNESVVEVLDKIASECPNETESRLVKCNPGHVFVESPLWVPHFTAFPQLFELGDRVLNINTSYHKSIPFGAEGTVISIVEKEYTEVLFDEVVVNTLSQGRRVLVPTKCLINLTQPNQCLKRGKQEKKPAFRESQIGNWTPFEVKKVQDRPNLQPKGKPLPPKPQPPQLSKPQPELQSNIKIPLKEIFTGYNPEASEFVPDPSSEIKQMINVGNSPEVLTKTKSEEDAKNEIFKLIQGDTTGPNQTPPPGSDLPMP